MSRHWARDWSKSSSPRSEEHTSELQSRFELVCRLLHEKTTDSVMPSSGMIGDRPMDMFRAAEGRWGSRHVEITDVLLLDRNSRPSFVFHTCDPMSIQLK